jgi:hypothetical protein
MARKAHGTPGPVRPLLALGQLFPGATSRFLSLLGGTPVLARRAEVSAARRRAAGPGEQAPVARQDDASGAS